VVGGEKIEKNIFCLGGGGGGATAATHLHLQNYSLTEDTQAKPGSF